MYYMKRNTWIIPIIAIALFASCTQANEVDQLRERFKIVNAEFTAAYSNYANGSGEPSKNQMIISAYETRSIIERLYAIAVEKNNPEAIKDMLAARHGLIQVFVL